MKQNRFCVECERRIESHAKKYCSVECYKMSPFNKWNNQEGEQNASWRYVITKDELVRLYQKELQSINTISLMKNCSTTLIKKRLNLWGIKKRGYSEQWAITKEKGRLNLSKRDPSSKKGNRKNYIEIAKSHFDWLCSACGKKETNPNFDLVVHRKDKNNKNNELSNLEVLCQNCHGKEHMRRRLSR